MIPLCIQFHYGTIRITMHRDEGTPRLGSKMGLKDEDLKHFVCEEEDEMCDVRKKNDLKDKLAKVLNFSDS